MTRRYLQLLSSDAVKAAQVEHGSRASYARHEGAGEGPDPLGPAEIAFLQARDSFYMATVGADGWPYIQHRGGPAGFVRILSEHRFGFADFRGNRQYISLGNLRSDGRAAFFFMDYANRTRLKVMGRVREADLASDAGLAAALADPSYRARVERALVVEVEAFDWNCPQHIEPRFTAAQIAPAVLQLEARIAELEAELARLRAGAPAPD